MCLFHRWKRSNRDYGFRVAFARTEEPEFWSPLFTIPTLLRSSYDQRSGGTLPVCILEILTDQWQGRRGQPWQAGTKLLFLLTPPIPSCRREAWESSGGGVVNSSVGGELPPLQQAQLAQGLSFSISQMETNWPLYCSAWPLGPL